MKRFNKSVDDLLLGKYGIMWNEETLKYAYIYLTSKDGEVDDAFKYVSPLDNLSLFGILAYENYLRVTPCREYHDQNCNAYRHKTCKYNGENFLEAGLEVISEIKKQSGERNG